MSSTTACEHSDLTPVGAPRISAPSRKSWQDVMSVLQGLSEIGASEVSNTGKPLDGSVFLVFGPFLTPTKSGSLQNRPGLFCQGSA